MGGDFERVNTPMHAPNFVNRGYVKVINKKSDWMSAALFISTNKLSDWIADVSVSLLTTEPIDFSVGSNMIKLRYTDLYAKFDFITNNNGVYTYYASIPNVSLDDIFESYGVVDLLSTFKYSKNLHLASGDYFSLLESSTKKEREEQVKKLKVKQNNDKFEALKKRYEVRYSASLNGYEVYSKKGGHGDELHARFGLLVKHDTDDMYKSSYIQFMVLKWQDYPDIMSVGAFYTEDGMYVIRRIIGNGYVGELGWKRPNGQVQYMFNYYILYDKSDNLQYLEKMINSGKKIYVEFIWQGAEPVKHWLYGVEIEQLKDLINFIKELHGEGL